MKRLSAVLLLLLLAASMLFAGGSKEKANAKDNTIHIVTTIFPIYDWAENLKSGVDTSISMLVDSGADLHNFQPTVNDMVEISSCDLFIYIGGESDKWVDDALKSAKNKNRISLNLMEILGDKAIEEEEFDDDGDHDHQHEHEHDELEYDEHIWLSLKNAKVLVKAIADAIIQLEPSYSATVSDNASSYIEKLSKLDKEYEETIASANTSTLLFADRFPFAYMCRDYNLDHYAAFSGCSAETEASFEKIVFLSGKVDELGLKTILKIEGSKTRIPETVRENTKYKNQQILTMDSMQSILPDDVTKEGKTYLSIMEENLATLKDALR